MKHLNIFDPVTEQARKIRSVKAKEESDDDDVWECKACGKRFSSKGEADRHIEEVIAKEKSILFFLRKKKEEELRKMHAAAYYHIQKPTQDRLKEMRDKLGKI